MDKNNFEYELRNTLHACADGLEAPEAMETRLNFALNQPKRSHRPIWRKRMVGIAAAALVVVGALAVGVGGTITSHSRSDQRLNLEETTEHLSALSADASLIQDLPDGFVFQYGYDSEGTAESQGKSEEFSEVNAVYRVNGIKLTLDAHKPFTVFDDSNAEDTKYGQTETKTVNDIEMTFNDTPYLFVPADYVLTEEEKAAEAAGEMHISYGSDEVEHDSYQNVSWEKDGLCYSLGGSSTGLTADELFDIASAFI